MKGKRRVERYDDQINDEYVSEKKLTPFQEKAVDLMYRLRAAKTSQIARILGYNENRARDWLRTLYIDRFLDRRYPEEEKKDNKGSVQGVYFLDEAGRLFAAGYNEIEIREVRWNIKENLVKYAKLRHTIECSEIIARIAEECRNANYKLKEFRGEKLLWQEYSYQSVKYEFSPDLYLKISSDKDVEYSFFVENDEATMSIPSFLEKVPKYENFKLSGLYLNEFDKYPKVLVITTTKERAFILAGEVAKRQKTKVDFLFTWHKVFYEKPFAETIFVHTSVAEIPKVYSMFTEIPEECRIGREQ